MQAVFVCLFFAIGDVFNQVLFDTFLNFSNELFLSYDVIIKMR